MVPVIPNPDIEAAADMIRPMLALYIGGMGSKKRNFHKDVFVRMGYEAECERILAEPYEDPKTGKRIVMAHPAYDQCIKASHVFNLLDARGVISVTERQAYIGRVRALAKKCADAFVETEAGGWAA